MDFLRVFVGVFYLASFSERRRKSTLSHVVWAGDSKTGLGIKIGPRQQKLWQRPNVQLMGNPAVYIIYVYFIPIIVMLYTSFYLYLFSERSLDTILVYKNTHQASYES